MSQPVKLSDALVLDARLAAQAVERSIAGQARSQLAATDPAIMRFESEAVSIAW